MSVTLATTDQYPLPYSLVVYQGGTFTKLFTWTTGPTEDDQTPVNLTGATASLRIKSGQTTVITLATGGEGITLGGTAGTIALLISATDTTALTPSNAEYDLLVTLADGSVTPLLGGLVTIRASVTAGG